MIENRITSALITEGDVDWDPRIRDQLSNFATAAANLTNFNSNAGHPLDYRPSVDSSAGSGKNPTISPYGNDWDILWLGNCGSEGEVYYPYPDETAPPYQNEFEFIGSQLGATPFGDHDRLPKERIVTTVRNALCTYAYAVSLRGAIKLASLSHEMDDTMDRWMSNKCASGIIKCVSPWPQLLCSSRGISDVVDDDGEDKDQKEALCERTLQYSIRVNAENVMEGKGIDEWIGNWD